MAKQKSPKVAITHTIEDKKFSFKKLKNIKRN